MKNKSLLIYISAVVVIVATILIFNSAGGEETVPATQEQSSNMPDDDIHKGLDGQMPSAGNVRGDFMEKYNDLKNKYGTDPNDTTVAKEFAIMLSQAHRKPQAVEIFNNILEKAPARTDILLLLGYEYYEMKDYDKAEEMTQKVLKYKKDNAQAKYNLGAISLAKGNKEEARKIWHDVMEKHPGTDAAKFAENSLRAMMGQTGEES